MRDWDLRDADMELATGQLFRELVFGFSTRRSWRQHFPVANEILAGDSSLFDVVKDAVITR